MIHGPNPKNNYNGVEESLIDFQNLKQNFELNSFEMTPAQKVNIKQLTYGENQDLIENQKSTVFDYNEKGFIQIFIFNIFWAEYLHLLNAINKNNINF